MRQAFSLVELSIVLVILGLLVGGVLSGQSLIRAAELRSLTSQLNNYQAGVQTFRDKYFALPGDMTNATSFWGSDDPSACINGWAGTAVTTATCNGNGDGALGGTNNNEQFRFWQQLADAGLIEGAYTGRPDPAGSDLNYFGGATACGCYNATAGLNSPHSKVSGVGVAAGFITVVGPYDFYPFYPISGNFLNVGRDNIDWNQGGFLKAEELWNIDTKMDDGKPGTGVIHAQEYACTTGIDPANDTYSLNNPSPSCYITYLLK